jgi:uncharacterized membrane protein
LAFLNIAILGACVVMPNLAATFNMTRFYQVTLFILAPFCVIGGSDILHFLSRKKVKEKYILAIIVLAVLIPYFLFQTGFVYEVTKEESYSLPLSYYRLSSPQLVITFGDLKPSDVSSAMWLARERNVNSSVCADVEFGILFIYVGVLNPVSLSLGAPVGKGSYVYLGEYNLFNATIINSYGYGSFNVTQIVPGLNETNLVYSSGSAEIYQVP